MNDMRNPNLQLRDPRRDVFTAGVSTKGERSLSRPSHLTRVIHLLLLIAVLNQLMTSQFMESPLPGDSPGLLYTLHEYVGLASFLIVFGFWIWALIRNGETRISRLFPWFSVTRIWEVLTDFLDQLRHLIRRDLSDDTSGAMASAVHGLGLLIVTAMAVTGSFSFFARGSALAHTALAVHSLMANLMWAYLIGHSALAALHHLLGSDILTRMFWLRRNAFWPRWRP
ncbi:cytochrome b/b6 domain-containing protein [Acidisoma cladoniae]|jgi:cytochrome b561|uniref:cytochrome b/b6 domain-containing protein n=1 Tax=Acidisoma cladoniae TaxID=3040935 RepID=UPI00254F9280|nr:cytochrome b/b6 domain-containing protein [Acidisoma sp. PAMC 29798]